MSQAIAASGDRRIAHNLTLSDNTTGNGSQWQGHAIGLSRTFTILTIAYAIISDM